MGYPGEQGQSGGGRHSGNTPGDTPHHDSDPYTYSSPDSAGQQPPEPLQGGYFGAPTPPEGEGAAATPAWTDPQSPVAPPNWAEPPAAPPSWGAEPTADGPIWTPGGELPPAAAPGWAAQPADPPGTPGASDAPAEPDWRSGGWGSQSADGPSWAAPEPTEPAGPTGPSEPTGQQAWGSGGGRTDFSSGPLGRAEPPWSTQGQGESPWGTQGQGESGWTQQPDPSWSTPAAGEPDWRGAAEAAGADPADFQVDAGSAAGQATPGEAAWSEASSDAAGGRGGLQRQPFEPFGFDRPQVSTNGSANGSANGSVNGSANGFANGHGANGSTNGYGAFHDGATQAVNGFHGGAGGAGGDVYGAEAAPGPNPFAPDSGGFRPPGDFGQGPLGAQDAGNRRKLLLASAGGVVALAVVGGLLYALTSGGDAKQQAATGNPGNGNGGAVGASPTGTPQVTPSINPNGKLGAKLKKRSTDPTPLTLGEVFKNAQFTSYKRVIDAGTTQCGKVVAGSALKAALKKGKCTQLLRATYRTKNGKLIGTVGIANLNTAANAKAAATAAAAKGAWLLPLPGKSGAAKSIGGAKAIARGTAQAAGHYVILTWIQRPDGKAFISGQAKAVTAFATQVPLRSNLDSALQYRGITGKPDVG